MMGVKSHIFFDIIYDSFHHNQDGEKESGDCFSDGC